MLLKIQIIKIYIHKFICLIKNECVFFSYRYTFHPLIFNINAHAQPAQSHNLLSDLFQYSVIYLHVLLWISKSFYHQKRIFFFYFLFFSPFRCAGRVNTVRFFVLFSVGLWIRLFLYRQTLRLGATLYCILLLRGRGEIAGGQRRGHGRVQCIRVL